VISYQLYIDGEWTGSGGASMPTVLNPATEEVIGTVPEGTPADIDRAVAASRRWPALRPVTGKPCASGKFRARGERGTYPMRGIYLLTGTRARRRGG